MNIRPITDEDGRKAALKEIDRLWGARPGTPEGDELGVLVRLVEAYEEETSSMGPEGDPIEILIAHMDVTGRSQADLAELLGSRSRASEILNRKRPLTLEMIKKLHSEWDISADLLIQSYELTAA